MSRVFDLIVIGAGPTGLMAAKVAGENGLRVALIEKKQAIPEVKRACGEVINVNEYSWGDYINFNARDGLLNFPVNGISVRYAGPYRNVYGMQTYSPGGASIIMGDVREGRKRGDRARRGIAIDKSELLAGTVAGSVQTREATGVWFIGMRYKIMDATTTEQVAQGYTEEKMEVGATGTSVMGVSISAKGGVGLDTMVQRLIQKNVWEIDSKYR